MKSVTKALACGAVLLGICSLASAPVSNVQAKRTHHHVVRIVKHHRRRRKAVHKRRPVRRRKIRMRRIHKHHHENIDYHHELFSINGHRTYVYNDMNQSELKHDTQIRYRTGYNPRHNHYLHYHDTRHSRRQFNKSSKMPTKNDQLIRQRTIYDINADRKARHLRPLPISYDAQRIADIRAKTIQELEDNSWKFLNKRGRLNESGQSFDDLVHGINPDGTNAADRIGKSLHVATQGNPYQFGENLTAFNPGQCFYYDYPRGLVLMNNKRARDAADNAEDDFLYHDLSSGNGHKDNLLNRNYRSMGVAVAYSPHKQTGSIEEVFDSY